MCVCVYYIYTYIRIYMCVCVYIIYTHTYVYIYIYIHVCVCVCVCIYIYIYTATCLPSRKLYKLDEPDTQDTAGEARTNLYIRVYNISSSYRAASTDIPDPLSPLLPIIHRLWQVLMATSCILT